MVRIIHLPTVLDDPIVPEICVCIEQWEDLLVMNLLGLVSEHQKSYTLVVHVKENLFHIDITDIVFVNGKVPHNFTDSKRAKNKIMTIYHRIAASTTTHPLTLRKVQHVEQRSFLIDIQFALY